MLLIFKKGLFLVVLTLYIICAHSQTVTSTRNGVWTDPATWVGGVVPTSVTATQIIIDHEVELPTAEVVAAFRVVVNNKLTLKSGATLDILDDGLPAIPDLQVYGRLVKEDGSLLNGTSLVNTRFEAGSFYVHQQGPLGFIPYATWDANSTFIINGFKASGYINIAHSDSWKQSFGNVIYDCPEQSSFVDLNGYLRDIQGDFTIIHTRSQALRLSTTQNPVISIGGNLRIEGPSQVWMSTNGTGAVVNIAGDFTYTSTSLCYLATRGRVSVSVGGSLNINTPSAMRMTALTADSVGVREASINIGGGLSVLNGLIAAPPPGNGKGTITFNGTGLQQVLTAANGGSFLGNLDFIIESNSIVSLGNSVLSNTSGALVVKGRIQLGSTDPLGAIQMINQGNLHIAGPRDFQPGSVLEYNGTGPQFIGNGHPPSATVDMVCNNGTTLTLLNDLESINNFSVLRGTFVAGSYTPTIHGDVNINPSATLETQLIRLAGSQDQEIFVAGKRLNNITINKTGGVDVTLTSPLILDGLLQIESADTDFMSNGLLTLTSSSDNASGTAAVGPLPPGSGIVGDVTVERFMSGEGRIYRYISSPVSNASVGDLMDDFPITGTFANPSSGPGINSPAPSFYFYDESVGGLQAGWRPYPTTGSASSNPLEPGKGYAAFIRKGTGSTIWDVTGILNQGEIQLPVEFTPDGQPSNGWNLVGNPYACTIDWDIGGPTGWTKQNISEVISIRDNGAGGGGTFRYWDGDINYSDIPSGQIASGQSIWVRATGVNPSLIIREGVKVSAGASFYREEQQRIPSFAVVIKRDGLHDAAFFKVRPHATSGLDDWDAIKQENDNFDIATFSTEGMPLAINAQETLPCGTERIQLDTKDLVPGDYEIELITKFDFEQYQYTWIDRFLNTETAIVPDNSVHVTVTTNPLSASPDRFVIQLTEPEISDSVSVATPDILCPGKSYSAEIANAQRGVFYSLWNETGNQVSAEEMGHGGDLSVELLLDSLPSGNSTLTLVARSSCQKKEMKATYVVIKENLPRLFVSSSRSCMGNSVVLTASSDYSGVDYCWFEDEDSVDTLSIASVFLTPELLKPKTYYVSAITEAGCSTSRVPVWSDIVVYDSAEISLVDVSTLASNYKDSNTWYHNGALVEGEHHQTLKVNASGMYTLEVDTLGCTTRDSIEFLTTAAHVEEDLSISIFPNPVRDKLQILTTTPSCIHAEIRNVVGEVVWSGRTDSGLLDVSLLSAGVYFVTVYLERENAVVRFIKRE